MKAIIIKFEEERRILSTVKEQAEKRIREVDEELRKLRKQKTIEESTREPNQNWRERWQKDLEQVRLHVNAGLRAVAEDNFKVLEKAVIEIESLVEPHA